MAATMLTMGATVALSPFSQVTFTRVQSARMSERGGCVRSRVVCMAAAGPMGTSSGPAINTGDKVAEKIEQAQEICAGDEQSEACATAWNEVESATQEKAQTSDPLEKFCDDNPEADECRVYSD